MIRRAARRRSLRFGEHLLRSDLSISVGGLGSLLDHAGPIGEHEKYGPQLGCLRALSMWDGRFARFGHDTHGVENRHGTYTCRA
jgi:arginine/lysine/ornithine decarboxylase